MPPPSGSCTIAVIAEIIAPIFGIVLLGWLAARLGVFDEAATRGLSLFAFNVAIPVMLVRTLAETELPEVLEWGLVLAYFLAALAIFTLAALGGRLLGRRGAEPGILGISAAFSNTIILGIPIALEAYGEAAALPLSLLIAFHSPVMFTATMLAAELGLGHGTAPGGIARGVGKGLLTNPILGGILVGLMLNLSGLALPAVLDRLAATLGAAALPSALFALGANLSRFHLARSLRAALLLSGLKLLLQPTLVYLLAAHVFRLPPVSLAVAVTIAALPSGINAYLFAARYDAAVPEATSTVLVSTAASVLTLSLLLAVLRG